MPLQSGSFAHRLPYSTIGQPLQPVPLPDEHTFWAPVGESDHELNALASTLASGSFAPLSSISMAVTPPSASALTSEDSAHTLQDLQDIEFNALAGQESGWLAVRLGKRHRRGEVDDERPAKAQRLSLAFGRSAARSEGQLLNVLPPNNGNVSILDKSRRDDMDMDVDLGAV